MKIQPVILFWCLYVLLSASIIGVGLWLEPIWRDCEAKGGQLDFGMHCYRIDLHRIDLD